METHALGNFSPAQLTGLLKDFDVDMEEWGRGEALTVNDFLTELKTGESSLRIDKIGLVRFLRIVKMVIEDPIKGYLLEDYQILADGTKKHRCISPSGKILISESPIQALHREMQEEIGLTPDQYLMLSDPWKSEPSVQKKPSRSYPGLNCLYEVHPFRIQLLPSVQVKSGYSIFNRAENKQIFFRWSSDPV